MRAPWSLILFFTLALCAYGWEQASPEQLALVKLLEQKNPKADPRALNAMRGVDRGRYAGNCRNPYQDAACSFDIDYQTISAPHMHLYALDRAIRNVQWSQSPAILDIGCGSGYLTAAFHELMLNEGLTPRVIGIDRIHPIVDFARENIQRDRPMALQSGQIILKVANGYEGEATGALGPYDVIHIGASTPSHVLDTLKSQLNPNGIIIAPEEPPGYRQGLDDALFMRVYRKVGNQLELITGEYPLAVRYVPLKEK